MIVQDDTGFYLDNIVSPSMGFVQRNFYMWWMCNPQVILAEPCCFVSISWELSYNTVETDMTRSPGQAQRFSAPKIVPRVFYTVSNPFPTSILSKTRHHAWYSVEGRALISVDIRREPPTVACNDFQCKAVQSPSRREELLGLLHKPQVASTILVVWIAQKRRG
jgi:hypothetical protein